MDPVVFLARLLLIVGCSGAALVPAKLGPSDWVANQQLRQPEFVAYVNPVPPAPTPDPGAGETPAPFNASSHLGFDPGSERVTVVDPEPIVRDLSFEQAARAPSSPVRVRIPSQGIDARIVPVGITPTGEMETPGDYDEVGWYRHGARPGEMGRAVLAGHLDSRAGPAVFFQLGSLQPGDTIEVQFDDGSESQVFTVRELAQYPVATAPLADIFGPVDRPELVLITCAGEFEGPESGYSERVIVYADVASGS